MRALLQRWLLARVWACTELEAAYATQHTSSGGASSRTTYRDGYWAALGRYSLKRCLQLWHCLELLKGARTLPADPPLFAVDAPFKSLADLAQEFAQRHLKGEANLARHLAHLGAPLKHRQSPLEELALGVKNLAVDLRDGVRLARVAEMVGNTRGLMQVCVVGVLTLYIRLFCLM
jgi:abnormal spindle-like microcephaly-associated protein